MHIPTYQIHNVIKGYIRHFCSESDNDTKSFFNHFKGFEDRKDDVLKKTALDIVDRILRLESPDEVVADTEQKSEFVFKTFDKNGNYIKNILSIEDNNFRIKPLLINVQSIGKYNSEAIQ